MSSKSVQNADLFKKHQCFGKIFNKYILKITVLVVVKNTYVELPCSFIPYSSARSENVRSPLLIYNSFGFGRHLYSRFTYIRQPSPFTSAKLTPVVHPCLQYPPDAIYLQTQNSLIQIQNIISILDAINIS